MQKGAPRAGAGARAYLGRISAGELTIGQRVRVLPSEATAEVAAIETFDGDLPVADCGQSVSVRLDREVDVSRGDWLVDADPASQPQLARHLRADLAWLDNEPLAPQRRLWLRHGTRFVLARVRSVDALLDLDKVAWHSPADDVGAAATLRPNDIGRVVIEVQHPLPFDSFDRLRATGAVVLDRRDHPPHRRGRHAARSGSNIVMLHEPHIPSPGNRCASTWSAPDRATLTF